MALAEIARELAVDTLVQGSVVVSDRRVRISIQLIDPFSDQHLWAESFERELSHIVILQAQIAQAVAQHIQARLTPEEDLRAKPKQRVNPESYEAYLKGLFFLANRNDIEKARSISISRLRWTRNMPHLTQGLRVAGPCSEC
jgi:hypothetical protein